MNDQELNDILKKGIFAPSADNLQPWLFHPDGGKVHFYLDRRKLASFCDFGYLIPYFSAGSVIENIRSASANRGYELSVRYFPEASNPLWVATLEWKKNQTKTHSYPDDILEKRATNRQFYFAGKKISPDLYTSFESLIQKEVGFKLLWIKKQDPHYPKISRVLGESDQLRFGIQRLHRELIEVLRFTKEEVEHKKDGLPIHSLEGGFPTRFLFRLIRKWATLKGLNHLGLSYAFNSYAQSQLNSSQAVGLLIGERGEPLDYMKAGEMMERLWHEITVQGLSIQPMEGLPIFLVQMHLQNISDFTESQKVKLGQLKESFYSLFGLSKETMPFFLFRIGYAPPPSVRAPRKSIESFLVNRPISIK